MRRLVADEGLEARSRSTARGRAAGTPASRPTSGRRRRRAPRRHARGRGAAGHARRTSRRFDLLVAMDREQPARPARRWRPTTRRATKVRLLRGRPGADATSTCPTPTTAATAASRRCSTWSRPPAAGCSTSCASGCEPRSCRRATRRAAASSRSGASAAVTSTTPIASSSPTGARCSSRPAPDAAPGEYAAEAAALRWLAEPGALGVPAVLGVADGSWRWSGSTRAAQATRRRSATGSRACTPPARTASAAPAPLRIGSLELPNEPLDDWPDVLRRAPAAPAAPGTRLRERQRAPSSACATGIADLAGPPEPPARLHGDLWSGNVLWSGGRRG